VITEKPETQRLDVWLWYARFFKTRSLATKVCRANKVRINGDVIRKASVTVSVDDVLTFPQGNQIRIAKVLSLGHRRGPAPEAQLLYEDLTPPPVETKKTKSEKVAVREKGAGRPTKAERRATDRLRDQF